MNGFAFPSRGDIAGGLTAGVVALPLCLAMGIMSGLGPEAGLYGAIAAGILASIFGGTPTMVTGPTTPMTLVAMTVVAGSQSPDGHINMSQVVGIFVLAGIIQIIFGALRLGGYVRYVPQPVISGFMSGIGVLFVLQQFFQLFGAARPSSDALQIISHLPRLPSMISWPDVILAALTFGIIQFLPRVTKAVPASLFALVAVTAASMLIPAEVVRLGAIPAGLPPLILPGLDPAKLGFMVSAALQLAFLGALDSLLGSLLADSMTKTRHDSNRELIGQGIGNIGAALIGGLPGAGANVRTIANINAGGRSRASGVIHGLLLLGVLLVFSTLAQYIPMSVLAAILVMAGLGCIDRRGFSHLRQMPRSDAVVMLLVLVLTVLLDVVSAVAIGLILACFIFMKKVADISECETTLTPLADEPWADEFDIPPPLRDQVLIKHVIGPLFFGSARGFEDIAAKASRGKLLIIRLEKISFMDQSGVYALHDALVDLQKTGLRIAIVGLPVAQRDILESICVIPDVVASEDVFDDFASLKRALPAMLAAV